LPETACGTLLRRARLLYAARVERHPGERAFPTRHKLRTCGPSYMGGARQTGRLSRFMVGAVASPPPRPLHLPDCSLRAGPGAAADPDGVSRQVSGLGRRGRELGVRRYLSCPPCKSHTLCTFEVSYRAGWVLGLQLTRGTGRGRDGSCGAWTRRTFTSPRWSSVWLRFLCVSLCFLCVAWRAWVPLALPSLPAVIVCLGSTFLQARYTLSACDVSYREGSPCVDTPPCKTPLLIVL
jgi:hypothetical protein